MHFRARQKAWVPARYPGPFGGGGEGAGCLGHPCIDRFRCHFLVVNFRIRERLALVLLDRVDGGPVAGDLISGVGCRYRRPHQRRLQREAALSATAGCTTATAKRIGRGGSSHEPRIVLGPPLRLWAISQIGCYICIVGTKGVQAMKGDGGVIEYLNNALRHELTAVNH